MLTVPANGVIARLLLERQEKVLPPDLVKVALAEPFSVPK